ncbi:KGG domain-containing protein [Sediminibacillus sp. JSM 1682029]|uniref:KGG domain-containing protein n=1 Tax=Sediminibacillus sp. JSM 1682029 TaxID=3229857 RepID=UPI003523E287
MADKNNNKKMSVEEAGRKGGETTSRNHDQEFYEEIGKKGGETRGRQQQNKNNNS